MALALKELNLPRYQGSDTSSFLPFLGVSGTALHKPGSLLPWALLPLGALILRWEGGSSPDSGRLSRGLGAPGRRVGPKRAERSSPSWRPAGEEVAQRKPTACTVVFEFQLKQDGQLLEGSSRQEYKAMLFGFGTHSPGSMSTRGTGVGSLPVVCG